MPTHAPRQPIVGDDVLTTTVDGLWVLQVLTGIEVLSPELGLRPVLPSVETERMAMGHLAAAELRAAGVLDESGVVNATVAEWLTVVSRRDVALFIQVRTPDDQGTPAGVLLARFAHWWVVMERSGDLIRISGVGRASAEGEANAIVAAQIERLCGANVPAPLRPVTIARDALLAGATDRETLRACLVSQRLDADQVQILMMAADPRRSAQASIVAIQSGVDAGGATRTHIEQGAVTIIDTPEGRLVAEDVDSAGTRWIIVAPGTAGCIASAANRMLRRLPADQEWYSYRKVV